MEAQKIRNEQNGLCKVQMIARDIRVVIERASNERGFFVEAQQYYPDCPYYWEVRQDGWRCTMLQWCGTFESAKRVFESMVRGESRFVESRNRR